MIWMYRYPTKADTTRCAFGYPVTVHCAGREIRAVYQFQGGEGDQQCAVVHLESGRVIARVYDHHKGYPQQRAQAAVDEKTAGKDPGVVWATISSAKRVNYAASVVWGSA